MKRLILILVLINATACASAPPQRRGFELPPALSEVFRGGQLKGLESSTDGDLGIPNQNDLVSRVCVSEPIFTINGEYVRTAVVCF